jgi:hypothetical protein
MPDGVHQVGFAQPGVTIDEKRVVRLRGSLRDGARRGVRHLVVVADDERFERVARLSVPAQTPRRPRPGPGPRRRRTTGGKSVKGGFNGGKGRG